MSVPMILTLGRLSLAPVYFLLYQLAGRGSVLLVAATWAAFILIEVSDLLDGHYARKLKQETEEGKVLDPLADSLSRLTYFICFAGSGILPLWILLVLVYRDVGVSYVRVLFARGRVLLPARVSGKVKAWVYAFAGGAGTAVFTLRTLDILPGFHEYCADTAFVLFLAAAGVALWSLGDYGLAFLKAAAARRKQSRGSG